MAEFKGMDVSLYQGKIDWTKVKSSGIQFAILRCGWGSDIASQDDTKFFEYVKGCEANNIPWGAYLYSYALNTDQAKSEAKHVLRLLKGLKPSYPIYFDMEDADGYKAPHNLSNDTLSNICVTFCTQMDAAGYYAGIYANRNWFETKLIYDKIKKWDFWLAEWASRPSYKKPFGMWQYTSSGKVNGINGNVDMDISYKDYPKIIKDANLNGWSGSGGGGGGGEGSTEIKVGDTVKYSGYVYRDSNGAGQGVKISGNYKVTIRNNNKFGVHLGDLGWVKPEDCVKVNGGVTPPVTPPVTPDYKVGDKVKIKSSAKTYATGETIPKEYKEKPYTIQQVKSDRVLIKELYSWVFKKDITK